MFAITPEADIGEAVVMSALCQKQTFCAAAEKTPDNLYLHKGAKSGDRFADD